MSEHCKRSEDREAWEATLRFAAASGAWVVEGQAAPKAPETPGPEAPAPAPDLPILSSPEGGALAAIREGMGDCTRCRLHKGRSHLVFGVGNPDADLMFVGEGPGEEEDRRGEPFVGRAGQLLDKMIRALELERSDVYIANVVKCRPPKNRDPKPDEVSTCLPFLWEQIRAIRPKVVVALGAHAARNLSGSESSIGKLRGRVIDCKGVNVVCTYHPAYLLRTPSAKRMAWEDLKLARTLFRGDA